MTERLAGTKFGPLALGFVGKPRSKPFECRHACPAPLNGSITNRSMRRETHLSTQQAGSQAPPRFPRASRHQERPQDSRRPPFARSQAFVGLNEDARDQFQPSRLPHSHFCRSSQRFFKRLRCFAPLMASDPLKNAAPKRLILQKRQEFLAVAAGRRVNLPLLTLQYRPRMASGQTDPTSLRGNALQNLTAPRFGLTITKKTGNSVVRNRIRRRLRAALDQIAHGAAPAHDYVIVARQACLTAPFHNLVDALNQALQKSRRPLKPSPTVADAAPSFSH
jgi:ribonuclease P protein component